MQEVRSRRPRLLVGVTVAAAALTALAVDSSGTSGGIPEHQSVTVDQCVECHADKVQGTESLGPQYGPGHFYLNCDDCHDLHGGTSNRKLIWEVIYTPNSGDRDVVYTNRIGPNSSADGDTTYDGICEVCHTTSAYHRNDGTGDQTHNPKRECTPCHSHNNGFEPYTFDCLTCHDRTQPFEAGDYRRQVVEDTTGTGGDFSRTSHHVSNGTTAEIVVAGDCSICHDFTGHGDYVNGDSLMVNDAHYGDSFLYDGTPESLESFCISCHDGTQTAPFSNGLPAVDIATQWATATHQVFDVTCGNCHANGHGSDFDKLLLGTYSLTDYTAYSSAEYDLCWACHSEQKVMVDTNRFEQLHNTHVVGAQAPCVICHDGHGAYDAGEPGKISFEYALAAGMDIQMIGGRDLSSSFEVSQDGTTATCYLQCHGQDHVPESYRRDLSATGIPGERGFTFRVRAFPSPSRGPMNLLVESSEALGQTPIIASIFDINGRRIRELRAEARWPGQTVMRWDGMDESGARVGSGIYLCRVDTHHGSWNTRFVVVR